jgi:hypothetical protein
MLRAAIFLGVVSTLSVSAVRGEAPWRVGVARVNITPELPIWLSGYGGRNKPAAEKLDDLWAKAIVLEDASGRRVLLVTMDLVGIDRDLSREMCRRIAAQHKLPRASIALSTSHTHSGPVMRGNLVPMYSLDEDQAARVEQYAVQLADKLVKVVDEAVHSLAPARLSWASGTATFAVNRRNNPEGQVPKLRQNNALVGPVDHDVPVLAIDDAAGELRAVVVGYACHATVLSGYQISADWPGAAQNEIERRHPNATALFWAGCGADQNPLPRRSVELMHGYGRQLADAVDEALRGRRTPIAASVESDYKEIPLPFAALPSRAELELTATAERPQGPWAKYLLSVWDSQGGLPAAYPYPIQVWRLGDDLTWLFLGGEVVVDYALRLKSELRGKNTWVASYSNDVMGYIPSRRVLAEGGYEGGLARFPYGLPAVWDANVEHDIIGAVHDLVGE